MDLNFKNVLDEGACREGEEGEGRGGERRGVGILECGASAISECVYIGRGVEVSVRRGRGRVWWVELGVGFVLGWGE